MKLCRQQDDLDNHTTNMQNVVSIIKEYLNEPDGTRAGQRKIKLMLQMYHGLQIHWLVVLSPHFSTTEISGS